MITFNKYYIVNMLSAACSIAGIVLLSVCLTNDAIFAGTTYIGLLLNVLGLTGVIISRVFISKWNINEWYARIMLTIVAFMFIAACVLFASSIVLEYINSKQIDPV